jgi:hypothetical protein
MRPNTRFSRPSRKGSVENSMDSCNCRNQLNCHRSYFCVFRLQKKCHDQFSSFKRRTSFGTRGGALLEHLGASKCPVLRHRPGEHLFACQEAPRKSRFLTCAEGVRGEALLSGRQLVQCGSIQRKANTGLSL